MTDESSGALIVSVGRGAAARRERSSLVDYESPSTGRPVTATYAPAKETGHAARRRRAAALVEVVPRSREHRSGGPVGGVAGGANGVLALRQPCHQRRAR